ncbi:hypothetical protein [Chitinophaga sancti]|uniref:hypothetical protein n=1 Tax=Chitinophaga sancti TaxID=1004 RepID=UPI003F78B4E9
MSRSKIFGIIAVVVVIVCAFLPWITVGSKTGPLDFTGLNTFNSNFGEPGKVNVFFGVVVGLLFLLKGKMAPRINLFLAAFLVAWTFRNLLLFSRCEMGECPERHVALFLSLVASLGAFVAVMFTNNGRPAEKKED